MSFIILQSICACFEVHIKTNYTPKALQSYKNNLNITIIANIFDVFF